MKFKKLISLMVLLLVTGYQVFSQSDSLINKKTSNTYIVLATGITSVLQKDFMVSPIEYKGNSLITSVGFTKRKVNTNFQINVLFNNTQLYNQFQNANYYYQLNNLTLQIQKEYVLRKLSLKKQRYFLGWNVTSDNDFRYQQQFLNSGYGYNLSLEISPTIKAERFFTIFPNSTSNKFIKKEREFRLSWQLQLPILSLVSRPKYTAISGINDGSQSSNYSLIKEQYLNQIELSSLHNYVKLASNIQLLYLMKNGNRWALNYLWNGVNYSKNFKQYQSVKSAWLLSFYFQINNQKPIK